MPRIVYKYSYALGEKFFELCKEGKSLTQISSILGVPKRKWIEWHNSTRDEHSSMKRFWETGREACQCYHETLLDNMIKQNVKSTASEIDAQKYRLKVMFKDDWSEKQDVAKIEISHISKLSDSEIQTQLDTLLAKPAARNLVLINGRAKKDQDIEE